MNHSQSTLGTLRNRICEHLDIIYGEERVDIALEDLTLQIIEVMRLSHDQPQVKPDKNKWDQRDVLMITYGDSIRSKEKMPLESLESFLDHHIGSDITGVHILPFFPYSSDDGFSVIDYSSVNEALGDWEDINRISDKYRLMVDLVINHCSSKSLWFENFKKGKRPGADYFICVDPETDLSEVVRPRTSPLLSEVHTIDGIKHVWCTFSEDQVDLNFRNPEVLLQIIGLIRLYLDMGATIFRLDAVAFIWKSIGTNCLNLQQAHEIVRLIRTLVDHAQEDIIIITETNIPNKENLSYFGNSNEAHCIYNFSLPPLLLHALVTGRCSFLKQWQMAMPPARDGTTYLNFIASHDGIGLRPAEGLLSEKEIGEVIQCMQDFGGYISWRAESGSARPYEINISFFDACKGTLKGEDECRESRFLLAHTIMMSLAGIPAIYVLSLLATENDLDRALATGNNRAINRHQWDAHYLQQKLQRESSPQSRILSAILDLFRKRAAQPAFHPNATQFTLHLGEYIFGFWRQSDCKQQSIFCIFNLTDLVQELHLSSVNLIGTDCWWDILSGEKISELNSVYLLDPYQSLWITNHQAQD